MESPPHKTDKGSGNSLGFWSCWALTAGIMIGSGIFLLPTLLAPYGLLSFFGWALTAFGSILIALVIARLSGRTRRSGGVYVYAQEAYGELTGFLVAWGYWAAYWIAIPAIAIAFVGYLGVIFPSLKGTNLGQALCALAVIWTLTLINMKSLKGAGYAQILLTVLKIIPLLLIILLGFYAGSNQNLPSINPEGKDFWPTLATTAILTMWAFSGLEAGAIAAKDVKDATRTIPKAILAGTLTVAFIYIASTYAVMRLVPADILINSTSPFADAAQGLGAWGPHLIAIGALIATAGSLNGVIFVTGQMPMALALDDMAPRVFISKNPASGPRLSLLLGSTLGSVVLLMNYSKGLIGMFTFLALMSTLAVLVPLLVAAAAEIKHNHISKQDKALTWSLIAILSFIYTLFAILGSGFEVIGWGIVLFLVGLPVYYWLRYERAKKRPANSQ